MAVTGFSVSDVAVLIGGSDFRLYEVPADAELQELIIEQEAEFWQRVQAGEPPEPVSYADASNRYRQHVPGKAVTATPAVEDALSALVNARACIKVAEREEEEAKAIIAAYMGDAETLASFDARTLATWKTAKPTQRFDIEAFKSDSPDLYAKYLKAGKPSRRFLIK
jgi:predicted phage-related endonuclease